MSSPRERMQKSTQRVYPWATWVGDFSLLKECLNEKDKPLWIVVQLLDALLRGFGQVAFSNNPISGFLIMATLAVTAPGTLLFAASTGFLGLLLSVLLRDVQHHIENGVTVLNPLILGSISFTVIPEFYGPHDAFTILLILLGTIFCVYVARALGTGKSPFTVWPFIITEIILLLVLSAQNNGTELASRGTRAILAMDNATSDATSVDASFIGENVTNFDWGMVFHGVVASASQLFALNNVATGSMVYLAVMIFSPTTAAFGFLGALIGTLTGLHLGANIDAVYGGFWGFNCFLAGASLGGNFLVLNVQSALATIVAIIFTSLLQFGLTPVMAKVGLPVLAIPFVTVGTIFVRLRNNPEDNTFVAPEVVSFPEKQRRDYLASRRAAVAQRIGELEEVDISGGNKRTLEVVDT